MENRKVKRGDIFCYDFEINEGSIQNGIRPALVIQTNNFNVNSTTTVIAAITTAQKGMYLPSHIFLGERYGLHRPSTVMLEQLRTVNQDDLGPYIGTVEDHATLNAISKALKKTYGLWFYQAPEEDVRCICRRCLEKYIDSNEYIISRRAPVPEGKGTPRQMPSSRLRLCFETLSQKLKPSYLNLTKMACSSFDVT